MVLKIEVMVPPTMLMALLTLFQDSTTECLRSHRQYFYSFINTNIIQGFLIAHGSTHIVHNSIKIVHGYIYILHDSTPNMLIYHELCSRWLVDFWMQWTVTNVETHIIKIYVFISMFPLKRHFINQSYP